MKQIAPTYLATVIAATGLLVGSAHANLATVTFTESANGTLTESGNIIPTITWTPISLPHNAPLGMEAWTGPLGVGTLLNIVPLLWSEPDSHGFNSVLGPLAGSDIPLRHDPVAATTIYHHVPVVDGNGRIQLADVNFVDQGDVPDTTGTLSILVGACLGLVGFRRYAAQSTTAV